MKPASWEKAFDGCANEKDGNHGPDGYSWFPLRLFQLFQSNPGPEAGG
jgi:hypothetical protein